MTSVQIHRRIHRNERLNEKLKKLKERIKRKKVQSGQSSKINNGFGNAENSVVPIKDDSSEFHVIKYNVIAEVSDENVPSADNEDKNLEIKHEEINKRIKEEDPTVNVEKEHNQYTTLEPQPIITYHFCRKCYSTYSSKVKHECVENKDEEDNQGTETH